MKRATAGKEKVGRKRPGRNADLIPTVGVLALSERDWETVIQALENPPKPNARLRKAFAKAKKIVVS